MRAIGLLRVHVADINWFGTLFQNTRFTFYSHIHQLSLRTRLCSTVIFQLLQSIQAGFPVGG
jgi:hypothetical protein